MAHLVETSEDDSWLAVASYVGELLDEGQDEGSKLVETAGSRFVDECKQLYAAERYADVLDRFAAQLGVLFSKAGSDQDLEGAVGIICHLLPRIVPATAAAAAAATLSAELASQPESRPERRLQALVNLYNVAWEPRSKAAVLMRALEFARAAGLADVVLPVVRQHADTWAADLRLGKAEERALYVACAGALRGCTRKPRTAGKEAYRLLCKCLATYEGATVAEAAAASPVAEQVVSEFLRSPDMFHFDHADNPAVAALAQHAQHAPLHRMLAIFLGGSVAEFQEFAASQGAAVLEAVGISREEALEKMRLLALMGLAHGASEVSFHDIAAALELPAGEVEAAVVQAIGKRLIEARIDQLARRVSIFKAAPRTFGAEQWAQLARQLSGWRESVATVQELGQDERSVLQRGVSQLSVGA